MTQGVSLLRLYVLRAQYLVIALFLGSSMLPALYHHAPIANVMHGAARCLFAGLALMALLGLRYPLAMLPLLLFEFVWKSIWLLGIGLPLWSAGRLDPASADTFKDCAIGLGLLVVVIPWPHVLSRYVKQPADRWR